MAGPRVLPHGLRRLASEGVLAFHENFRTPFQSKHQSCSASLAIPLFLFRRRSLLGDLTAIGTLFAFILVCLGVCPFASRPGSARGRQDSAGAAGARSGWDVLFCIITMNYSLDSYNAVGRVHLDVCWFDRVLH